MGVETRATKGIRRLVALATGVVLAATLAIGATAPAAHADSASDAQTMLALTNQTRAEYGLAPLTWDPAAANIASWWSGVMADAQRLYHNPYLTGQVNEQVTTEWTRIGENVGYAYSLTQMHQAFLGSSPHLANILGDYNRVGIGVLTDGAGRIWVTLDFINGPALAPPPPPPPPPPVLWHVRAGAQTVTQAPCTICKPITAVHKY